MLDGAPWRKLAKRGNRCASVRGSCRSPYSLVADSRSCGRRNGAEGGTPASVPVNGPVEGRVLGPPLYSGACDVAVTGRCRDPIADDELARRAGPLPHVVSRQPAQDSALSGPAITRSSVPPRGPPLRPAAQWRLYEPAVPDGHRTAEMSRPAVPGGSSHSSWMNRS